MRKAGELRSTDRGERPCDLVLVVAVWCERHRGTGDAWGAGSLSRDGFDGDVLRCIRHTDQDGAKAVRHSVSGRGVTLNTVGHKGRRNHRPFSVFLQVDRRMMT